MGKKLDEELSKLSLEQLLTLVVASNENVYINDLCDYRFSIEKLDFLIQKRKNGIDISMITNPLIPYENLEILVELIINKQFVKEFAEPTLNKDKLLLMVEAYNAGININGLSNPYIKMSTLSYLINLRVSGDDRAYKDISHMNPLQIQNFLLEFEDDEIKEKVNMKTKESIDKLKQIIISKEEEKELTSNNPSRGKIYQIYKKNTNK